MYCCKLGLLEKGDTTSSEAYDAAPQPARMLIKAYALNPSKR